MVHHQIWSQLDAIKTYDRLATVVVWLARGAVYRECSRVVDIVKLIVLVVTMVSRFSLYLRIHPSAQIVYVPLTARNRFVFLDREPKAEARVAHLTIDVLYLYL